MYNRSFGSFIYLNVYILLSFPADSSINQRFMHTIQSELNKLPEANPNEFNEIVTALRMQKSSLRYLKFSLHSTFIFTSFFILVN